MELCLYASKSLTFSLAVITALSVSLSLCHTNSHTHTDTHTHSHTAHTHTPTHTDTHTHSHCVSPYLLPVPDRTVSLRIQSVFHSMQDDLFFSHNNKPES